MPSWGRKIRLCRVQFPMQKGRGQRCFRTCYIEIWTLSPAGIQYHDIMSSILSLSIPWYSARHLSIHDIVATTGPGPRASPPPQTAPTGLPRNGPALNRARAAHTVTDNRGNAQCHTCALVKPMAMIMTRTSRTLRCHVRVKFYDI